MADNLDDIKQNIVITVTDKGVDESQKDLSKLNTTITDSTKATEKNTSANKKNEEGFKSYKQQIKEATIAQQKLSQQYGATSDQAIDAAKQVAKLTDEMDFQKDLAKSYNPDEKFRALSQTAGLATLALGGVKDGLAALGIENKTLDQIIGSAQAILGVTSAVSGITDAYELLTAAKKAKSAADVVEIGTTEALTVVETEATIATVGWNTALLANPIVLITAGIIAAGAAIYAYTKIVSDSATEEEKAKVASLQLSVAIDQQSKAFDNNSKYLADLNNHKLALLKASGASEAQIYKETAALKAQEIQLAQNYRNEAIRLEQRAYDLDKAGSTDITKEGLKKAQENLKKANDIILQGFNDQDKIRNDHEIAVVQAATDARLKAEQEAEANRKKAIQKDIDDKKKAKEKAIQDAIDLAKSEAQAKRDADKELHEADKARNEQYDKENAEAEANRLKQAEEDAKKEIEIAQRIASQKQAIQDSQINLADKAVGFLSSIAGKNKTLQKAAIIAESALGIGRSVIATNASNVAAVAEGAALAIPTGGASVAAASGLVTANYVALGLGTAANIAATTKALQSLGGGSAPTASGSGNVKTTPSRNVAQVGFQGSSENQISTAIAQQQKDSPPLKAFVVSQEVTDAQELQRKKLLNNGF